MLPWRDANSDPDDPGRAVAVVDTRNGQVVFCRWEPSYSGGFGYARGEFALLAPDGSSLLATHRYGDRRLMTCHAIPPHQPWQWIAGVPLAVGAVVLSLRVGWRRVRRRPAPVPQGAPPCP